MINKPHTAGNKIRYKLDYSEWLPDGDVVVSATVLAAPSQTVVDMLISGVAVTNEGHVVFFIAGGTVSEVFTVRVQATTNRGEIDVTDIAFFVIAP